MTTDATCVACLEQKQQLYKVKVSILILLSGSDKKNNNNMYKYYFNIIIC